MAAGTRSSSLLKALAPLRELAERLDDELDRVGVDLDCDEADGLTTLAVEIVRELDRLVAVETRARLRFALRARCHAAAAAVDGQEWTQARVHLVAALATLDEVVA